ncbi:MAG: NAD(+)/NADH kinase [Planctomycetota bacterium]|jgi:NAD+ kinase
MKRLGLFGWLSRPAAAEVVDKHRAELAADHAVSVFDIGTDLPPKVDVDLAVIFGGDGTILAAARYLAPQGVPAVGVNLGRFGFLAGCVDSQCCSVVRAVLSGAMRPVSRTMLAATVTDGQREEDLIALNDVTITSSVPTHMIGLDISINSIDVSTFQGDGLIVATATGSTAYNLSSGGPLVAPTEDVLVLTALAPHTLAIRPMVISGSDVVDVTVGGRQSEMSVTADGQVAVEVRPGARVQVRRAPFRFDLYESEDWSFYRVVRSKLRWGEEPNYVQDSD